MSLGQLMEHAVVGDDLRRAPGAEKYLGFVADFLHLIDAHVRSPIEQGGEQRLLGVAKAFEHQSTSLRTCPGTA
ncbi:hypothetical protein D3C81_2057950 [compost metagenome]